MIKSVYKKESKELPIEEKIYDFLMNDSNNIEEFIKSNNLTQESFDKELIKFLQTILKGGDSYGETESYDPEEFEKGFEIEGEHVNTKSSYAKFLQTKITSDHLSESLPKKNSKYNSMLILMEKMMKMGITEEDIKSKLNLGEE